MSGLAIVDVLIFIVVGHLLWALRAVWNHRAVRALLPAASLPELLWSTLA